MNLAIRGIDGKIEWGDSFLNDKHKDLKADYILANPPFNMEDWGYSKVKNDVRWRRFDQPSGNAQFSLPPGGERKRKDGSTFTVDGGNANYAWILHFLHHLPEFNNGTPEAIYGGRSSRIAVAARGTFSEERFGRRVVGGM